MHTRMLTAAVAAAALMAGSAMAQSTTQTMPQGSTTGAMGAQGSMSGQATPSTGSMGAQGSMSGSMGSTNAGGAMGAQSSGNMNAGGAMSGNMNAGGAMGSTMASSAPPCIPAVGASTAGGMSGTGPGMGQPTITASANGLMMCSSGTGTLVVSNAPIPDSPSNRAQYGGPQSRAGKMTAPRPGPTTRSRRR